MAQELLRLDIYFHWLGDATPQRMTRWAQQLRFSYGSGSLIRPRDGSVGFDNRDGRFTPRGKSLFYPREVLITPTPFFVALESDSSIQLVSGLAQRVDARESAEEMSVFTLTPITTRNLDVQPARYSSASGDSSIVMFDRLATALGTTRDPNRTVRPPTNIEGIIEWPPVIPIDLQDATPIWPVSDAVAEWVAWCNQPVFVLRDGRIGSIHPNDTTNINQRSISNEEMIISAEPGRRPYNRDAPELINNVLFAAGYDNLTGVAPSGAPEIPRILRVEPEQGALTLFWEPAARARGYFPQINGNKFPEVSGLSFRFETTAPTGGTALSPATSYLLGVSSVNSSGPEGADVESAPDFITRPTAAVPVVDRASVQRPGAPSNIRLVTADILTGAFQIVWDPPIDTATTDVADSYDYRWIVDTTGVFPAALRIPQRLRLLTLPRSLRRVHCRLSMFRCVRAILRMCRLGHLVLLT